MIVNPEIITILDNCKINREDALTYLLALYNKLNPSYIPENLKRQIYANGIINRGTESGTVIWLVPLFKESDKPTVNTDWVTNEYREMFRQIRIDAGGNKDSCIEKMKTFMKNHPDVTKEEIILAAKAYLDQFYKGKQSITYLQRADYFIIKSVRTGGGLSHESRLEQYIELIRKEKDVGKLHQKNIMR